MPNSRTIIIGAGHNGLVTAFYLARAGLKPLVLERRAQVGGAAVTEEFHPGFRVSTLAHSAGPIRPDILRDMELEKHGLKLIVPEVAVTSFSPDGRALTLYRDLERSVESIAAFSKRDAERYREFAATLAKLSKVIAKVLALTPPEIENPATQDLLSLLQVGRSVRGLGKKDTYNLLRWAPMPVADLVAEFFETELLRATIAARGIFGTVMGPWSAGSSLVLLLRAAADPNPAGGNYFATGGIGALTQAMASAAQQAGAEIRTNAEVAEVRIGNGAAQSVILSGGEEIPAGAVISNADPKRTFLKLVDPVQLMPTFTRRLQNYRVHGTVAKLNLALSALPTFKGVNNGALSGRIQIGPEIDYIEHAFDESKYGNFSRAPYLEFTIPSLTDASLAPAGQHVMSIYMQYAPYNLRNSSWRDSSGPEGAQLLPDFGKSGNKSSRQQLAETIIKTVTQYATDLPEKIVAQQVITPLDLEETYGLTGGHIFHGELALDQVFTMRPFLDWSRYRTPIKNLYLCGSGTHPGTGLTGASGANAAREILKDLK
jgi:phytoene dehydrogenase-like protein